MKNRFLNSIVISMLFLTMIFAGGATPSHYSSTYTTLDRTPSGAKLPVDTRVDRPLTGLWVMMVDDGYNWQPEFAESLAVMNNEAQLTGTIWEMGFTSIINPRNSSVGGGNAVRGWNGNDADGGNVNIMTEAQLQKLDSYGFVEIGNHGYNHDINDPYGGGTNGVSILEVHTIRKALGDLAGVEDSSSVISTHRDGVRAIRDTLGLNKGQVYTYGAAGHRADEMSIYYGALSGIKNFRAGTWRHKFDEPFTDNQVVTGKTTNYTQTTTGGRGAILQYNRANMDPFAFWWTNFDRVSVDMYSALFPVNRMYMNHIAPGAADTTYDESGGDGFTTDAERAADFRNVLNTLADMKGFGIHVMHNIEDQSAGQDFGGIDSLCKFIRDIVMPASVNGLRGNEGPILKMAKCNEALEWRMHYAHQTAPILTIRNIHLVEGLKDDGVPAGFPNLISAWTDSGWTYADSAQAVAAGGVFGIENNGGTFYAPNQADGDYDALVTVVPVIPNTIIMAWCYATCDTLRSAAHSDSIGSPTVGEFIDIRFTPFRWNWDPTDSTITFGIGSDANGPEEEIFDWGYRQSGTDWLSPPAAYPSDGQSFYEKRMFERRFHMHDGWNYQRANYGTTQVYYNRISAEGDTDEGIKWRPFAKQARVPPDANFMKIEFIPTNFVTGVSANADTISISGIEAMLVPW